MEKILTTAEKLIPVFSMMILGYVLKKIDFFTEGSLESLKKLVLNIGLPALLFTAFSQIEFKTGYLMLFVLMFSICTLLLIIGFVLKRFLRMRSDYFPFLMTGFEAGMIGYSLYTVLFGVNRLYEFALVDFGHVTFVFSIFVGTLMITRGEPESNPFIFFVKSPPIIGVIGGLLIGSLRIFKNIESSHLLLSIHKTLGYLGGLVVPLICIIIGYEIEFSNRDMKEVLKTVIVRLVVTLFMARVIGALVTGPMRLDSGFKDAITTMMILPPPFITPLFIDEKVRDKQYVLSVLSIHTIFSLILATVLFSHV